MGELLELFNANRNYNCDCCGKIIYAGTTYYGSGVREGYHYHPIIACMPTTAVR